MSEGCRQEDDLQKRPGHTKNKLRRDDQVLNCCRATSRAKSILHQVQFVILSNMAWTETCTTSSKTHTNIYTKTDTTMAQGWYILGLTQVARSSWSSSDVCPDRSAQTAVCSTWLLAHNNVQSKQITLQILVFASKIRLETHRLCCVVHPSLWPAPVNVPQMFWQRGARH